MARARPHSSAPTLARGTYTFKCLLGSQPATASQSVQIAATTATASVPVAVKPVTLAELAGPNKLYQAYAAAQLSDLAGRVATIQADLRKNDLAKAKVDWLAAQLDWERVGASYDSFGDLGLAVDGLPDGLPTASTTRASPACTGSSTASGTGQSAAELMTVANASRRTSPRSRRT